jgi:hypothetical protein
MGIRIGLLLALLLLASPLAADEEEEPECPLLCATNEAGEWDIELKCEAPGQKVWREDLVGFTTRFVDGMPVTRMGEVLYRYGGSGNEYTLYIEITVCEAHETGYCIGVVATGENLGEEPVTCMNF